MLTDGLDFFPETPAEHVHFAAAERAARIHERARLLRQIVVVPTLGLTLASAWFPAHFGPVLAPLLNSPAAWGISLFASFFTIALEHSTRRQCDDQVGQFWASAGVLPLAALHVSKSCFRNSAGPG